jgi:hypothetical protein
LELNLKTGATNIDAVIAKAAFNARNGEVKVSKKIKIP